MKYKNISGISYFDPPKGKTKELIDSLVQQKKLGQNEGGDEIIAVTELLSNIEKHPYLNTLVMRDSPIWALTREFAQAFFPHPPKESLLLEYLATKHQWDELPIYAIGLSNATNALTACLKTHGVEGGEVITTSFNFASAPNAIVSAGGIPRFVETDPKTFSMDISSCLKTVNKKTRAILITHVNQGIDLLPLIKGLEKKGGEIAIFQDATAAMGSTFKGLGVGQVNPPPHGATVFSLGPTKVVSGLGGALMVSHDYEFLRRVESISFYGLNPSNDEEILEFGNNFKMNEISSVIAFEQLKKRALFIAKRREIKKWYDALLKGLVQKGKLSLQELSEGACITHYMVKLHKDYHAIIRELAGRFKVGLGHWYAFHLEPIYRLKFASYDLPITEELAKKIVSLPFHVGLEKKDVQYIVASLETVLNQAPSTSSGQA